jgi:hypothetical protein
VYLGIYLENPGLRSLKECERYWNPEARIPPEVTISIHGRTPGDIPNVNASRQIGCRFIIHITYRGAIIKCPERNLRIRLVKAIYRHRSADEIDNRDIRDSQGVKIIFRGTCNQELRWEDEERAVFLEMMSTGHTDI